MVAVTVGIEGSRMVEEVTAMEEKEEDEEDKEVMSTAARAVGRAVAKEEEEKVVWVDADSAAVFVLSA